MKTALVSFAIAAAVATTQPSASPDAAAVRVSIGPDLTRKTKVMDAREFDYLTRELKRSVEKQLDRSGTLRTGGGELHLVIEDARPNRPTLREMSSKPGLSYSSFGVGGARISGTYRPASGGSTPVEYSWYETDIRWAQHNSTWGDADRAFDRLATRLANDRFDDR